MKFLFALLFKGAIGKWLITLGSMLVSMAVYAYGFGWPFAVGFVLLILVHELGHFIAARQAGLQVGAPVFIPFVGAWIALKDERMAPRVEAHVAIAGPMLGSIAAFILYLAAIDQTNLLLMSLAQAGFLINLFNLIPLSPLDGGRLAGTVSPKLWLIGVPILIGVFMVKPSPLLVLVALAALPRVLQAFRGGPKVPTLDTLQQKLAYGGLYVGLVIALSAMIFEAHQQLGPF